MTRTMMTLAMAAMPFAASAACPDDAVIADRAAAIAAGVPLTGVEAGGSLADAQCAQDKLVEALQARMGPPVGYKAGLTSAATQERFGADEPVRGVLLAEMIHEDGASLPADFGARPLFEADLIVVVGDAAINEAATPEEVARHVSAVRPFMELPDLMVAEGEPIDAGVLTALNVGARAGVLGDPVEVDDPAELARALEEMTVRLTDGDGAELSAAQGSAVLGNPLNAVIWLTGKGVELEEGDLVSVGSIGPLLPPAPGQTVTARYEGLPGNPMVSVSFE